MTEVTFQCPGCSRHYSPESLLETNISSCVLCQADLRPYIRSTIATLQQKVKENEERKQKKLFKLFLLLPVFIYYIVAITFDSILVYKSGNYKLYGLNGLIFFGAMELYIMLMFVDYYHFVDWKTFKNDLKKSKLYDEHDLTNLKLYYVIEFGAFAIKLIMIIIFSLTMADVIKINLETAASISIMVTYFSRFTFMLIGGLFYIIGVYCLKPCWKMFCFCSCQNQKTIEDNIQKLSKLAETEPKSIDKKDTDLFNITSV